MRDKLVALKVLIELTEHKVGLETVNELIEDIDNIFENMSAGKAYNDKAFKIFFD